MGNQGKSIASCSPRDNHLPCALPLQSLWFRVLNSRIEITSTRPSNPILSDGQPPDMKQLAVEVQADQDIEILYGQGVESV